MPSGVVGSWGPDVAAYVRTELGIRPDRWQERAWNRMLAYRASGELVHRLYLLSTGRQNGKTLIVRGLVGWALTAPWLPDWSSILGLAHERTQARIPYEAVRDDLEPIRRRTRNALHLTRYLGIRSELWGLHRSYNIGSRESRNSIRGTSNDLGLFDELRTQVNYDTMNALEPTTRARPNPLILGTSTAGDDRAVLLRDLFERGRRVIDGVEPAEGFGMTWYAAPDDADPHGRAAILAANPGVAEGRIRFAPVAASRYSLTPSGYLTETLNLWSEGVDEWLPSGTWAATVGEQPQAAQAVYLGVDAVPSWRRATVVAAIVTDAGVWVGVAGELDADRTGASSIAPARLTALVRRLAGEWHPAAIAYSAAAAAARNVRAGAEAAAATVVELGPRQVRAASAMLRAELVGARLRHPDDLLLAQQARVARPSSPIEGGDWYLSVRDSAGDIDAIRAAAWALYAALAPDGGRPTVH